MFATIYLFIYLKNKAAPVSDSQLATLTYFNISKESPEYKSVDSVVDFQFNQLFVMLNRETLLTIMDFFSNDLAGGEDKPPESENTTTVSATTGIFLCSGVFILQEILPQFKNKIRIKENRLLR